MESDVGIRAPLSMEPIEYVHDWNSHTIRGARAVLEKFLECPAKSLLDIGCGTGTWLRAALELGVAEVKGIDGIDIPAERLLIPREFFEVRHLSLAFNLKRRFDVALCLEVAEHLHVDLAPRLIQTLTIHSDQILFSAACPGQAGQHHVNCQWPFYWQRLFNERGFICDDKIRWQIWDLEAVEPWYRQNIFTARYNPVAAGKEPRINPVIHPELCCWLVKNRAEIIKDIEQGSQPAIWYMRSFPRALSLKIRRSLMAVRRRL